MLMTLLNAQCVGVISEYLVFNCLSSLRPFGVEVTPREYERQSSFTPVFWANSRQSVRHLTNIHSGDDYGRTYFSGEERFGRVASCVPGRMLVHSFLVLSWPVQSDLPALHIRLLRSRLVPDRSPPIETALTCAAWPDSPNKGQKQKPPHVKNREQVRLRIVLPRYQHRKDIGPMSSFSINNVCVCFYVEYIYT
ncbi:hypothetical protein LY78DRAFT_265551 [Colletotrichum sublineola]|nr:hypothetical protein LY78DRAFT_265551 [Colletotrichum sublineola]